jgi:hypothetical protein
MKAYRGVEAKLQSFLELVLVGGEWLNSHPGPFLAGEKSSFDL